MFRQAKSAFIWYHLYKFRKTFIVIFLLLAMVVFSQWIYSDVVEYLTLREKLEYLDFILPIKWVIIFFNIGLSCYLFLSLFRTETFESKKEENKEERKNRKFKEKEEAKTSTNNEKEKFTKREKEFLYKKKLKTKADTIVQK